MSWTLFRYVAATYLRYVGAIFIAVLTIYLVADYVDRSRVYTGPNWVFDVLELYAFKALLVTRQLAPAALLLGAGAAISALRKNGEVVAMQSLRMGPAMVYVPVAVCTLVLAAGLVLFDEALVVHAGVKVDEITVGRFNSWGDWQFYNAPKRWFRVQDWILNLRGGGPKDGYTDVTLLRMTPSFQLERRIDAARMEPKDGTTWRLEGAVERRFSGNGSIQVSGPEVRDLDLGVGGDAFAIHQGRPEQMHLEELRQEIDTRKTVGLPSSRYVLALQDRFAYPLAGVPAALLAVGLALRPTRRGNLTAALVEGLVIVMGLWGMTVVAKTLVVSERLSALTAAWLPFGTLLVISSLLWLRREGALGWKGA